MLLISLQFSYALLGGLMNFMSLLHYRKTRHYYTPTNPTAGVVMMILYAFCVPLQLIANRAPYQVLMVVFAILISLGGVLKHLLAKNSEGYTSATARWTAIAINTYGVCLSTYSIVWSFGL